MYQTFSRSTCTNKVAFSTSVEVCLKKSVDLCIKVGKCANHVVFLNI